jgi:hypothetical protein
MDIGAWSSNALEEYRREYSSLEAKVRADAEFFRKRQQKIPESVRLAEARLKCEASRLGLSD